MDKLLEQKVIITIIDQKNLDPDLIGSKVTYLDNESQGIDIPWLKTELDKAVENSLLSESFVTKNLVNENDPGQQVTVILESCLPPEELVILGGGHIARALVKIAKMIGFRIVVFDNRPGFASTERFPEADRVIIESYEKAEEVLDLGRRSYVVVVTQDHRNDWVCLRQMLKYPLAYLGVIGSRRKTALTREKMLDEGFELSRINNIYMPIGLDIGAETPEEIAISIAAELIKVRYGGSAASLSGIRDLTPKSTIMAADVQFDIIKKAVNMANHSIPAAVATIFAAEGSTPRKAGSRMIIKEDGSIYGTIGGGKGEVIICEKALEIIKNDRPGIFRVTMNADLNDELGMICGGDIQVFIEPVRSFALGFKENSEQ